MGVSIGFRFRRPPVSRICTLFVAVAGLGATAWPALARDDTPRAPTPARLGFIELRSGLRAFVRAGGANIGLGLVSLEPGYTQLEVNGGHAALDWTRPASGSIDPAATGSTSTSTP
jgi:hypothetical protein